MQPIDTIYSQITTMKKLFVIGIFLVSPFFMHAQNEACDILQKAGKAGCAGKTKKASKYLESFYHLNTGHFLAEETELKLGDLYRERRKYDISMNWYAQLINRENYKETDLEMPIDCEGLMISCPDFLIRDRLLVLQHEAWIGVADIGMKTKDYKLVDNALLNADRYYRFWYGCGTSDMEEDLRMSLLYSDYFLAIGKTDSALAILLPGILEGSALPVPYYKEVVKKSVELLQNEFYKTEIRKKFQNAVDNLYFELRPAANNDSIRIYFIRFMNVPVQVAPAYLFGHQEDLETVKAYIRESEFARQLFSVSK